MALLKQKIRFEALPTGPISDLLGLKLPIDDTDTAFRQLRYVHQYVKELGGKSLVVESHYIDRDYMEDHSVFYSKNLVPLPNFCCRVHFFAAKPGEVKAQLKTIRAHADQREFREASNAFARKAYLGFTVIKPLQGCPVGRTVLRSFPERTENGSLRHFDCGCDYTAHLAGVPLTIRGLAFQQQDLGVSACATTALWSALQRTRAMEEGSAVTPAQITIRASQFALPFGRSMPSEGLSLDQMCQAIQSLGYAPNLIRADNLDEARGILYSSACSGMAPVLILSRAKDEWHAVVVAGFKSASEHRLHKLGGVMDDLSGDLLALYIHDDRFGPYLRAELRNRKNRPHLYIPLREGTSSETWRLSHILVPVHNKIRLSFGELRRTAFKLVAKIAAFRQTLDLPRELTLVSCSILKSDRYTESKIVGPRKLPIDKIEALCGSIPLSRYVGVIRLEFADCEAIEVLIDTTSTERNLNCLAVVQTANQRILTEHFASFLAQMYRCPLI